MEGAVRSSAVLKARSNAAAATLATDTARALILGDRIEEETGSSRPRGQTAVKRKRDRLAPLMGLTGGSLHTNPLFVLKNIFYGPQITLSVLTSH